MNNRTKLWILWGQNWNMSNLLKINMIIVNTSMILIPCQILFYFSQQSRTIHLCGMDITIHYISSDIGTKQHRVK